MKRVLFSAFIGSANLGDQAIFSAITQQLEKDKDIAVAAFTLDRRRHKDIKTVRFIQTHNPFRIIGEIYRCDLLIIGGGGIIQDVTSIYDLLRHSYRALIAICLRKPYIFYAVGVSELQSVFNRVLARFILQKAAAITVRDTKSKANIKKLGLNKEVIVTADPATSLKIKHVHTRVDSFKPYIVVCLRHWFDINRYLPVSVVKKFDIRSVVDQRKYKFFTKTIASFLDWIVKRYKYRIVFLPMFDTRDNRVHEMVLDQMKQHKRGINIKRQCSLEETVSIIANAEFVIGMRLHSLIFSATQYIPFIALNYMEKVANFLKELALDNVCLNLEELTPQKLKHRFTWVYTNKGKIKSLLSYRVRMLQERESKNNVIISEILSRKK